MLFSESETQPSLRFMRIATWNVNSVNARLPTVLAWLEQAAPDVACFQEIKCVDEKFPREAFESLGYNVETHGQKSYNGVALLSKYPLSDIRRGLPGDETDEQARYIEALVEAPRPIRVGAIYLPNGNPIGTEKFAYKLAWFERLNRHARDLLAFEEPLALCGDYNVIPEAEDAKNPAAWTDDALFQPQSRQAFRALKNLGLADARDRRRTRRNLYLLGLSGRRLAAGPRHPHRLRASVAPGRRPLPGDRDPSRRARHGQTQRPRSRGGRH